MTDITTRSGYAALIGRPNVGKSTLLNKLLGQKLSITSHKPQTTRHTLLGINNVAGGQIVYVDTPGLHSGGKHAMNRYMNRAAGSVIDDVDVVVFLVEGLRWTDEDQRVLERLASTHAPVILAVNKVDRIEDKSRLLPHLQELAGRRSFAQVIPMSARSGDNVAVLEEEVLKLLPIAAPLFPEDQLTDRSERFLAAELIREKLFRRLGQELPYSLTVQIEKFREEKGVLHIDAIIWVARDGHKAIVIGKNGEGLKTVGQTARKDMEQMFGHPVFLQTWVKVKEGWMDDERAMRTLGFDEQ
jgi:GTP-binding protein Era